MWLLFIRLIYDSLVRVCVSGRESTSSKSSESREVRHHGGSRQINWAEKTTLSCGGQEPGAGRSEREEEIRGEKVNMRKKTTLYFRIFSDTPIIIQPMQWNLIVTTMYFIHTLNKHQDKNHKDSISFILKNFNNKMCVIQVHNK